MEVRTDGSTRIIRRRVIAGRSSPFSLSTRIVPSGQATWVRGLQTPASQWEGPACRWVPREDLAKSAGALTVQAASSEVTEAQQESGATARDCGSIPTGRSGGGRGDVVRCADWGTLPHVEPLSLFLNIVDWRRGGKNRRQHKNHSETCDCRSLFTLHIVNQGLFQVARRSGG